MSCHKGLAKLHKQNILSKVEQCVLCDQSPRSATGQLTDELTSNLE